MAAAVKLCNEVRADGVIKSSKAGGAGMGKIRPGYANPNPAKLVPNGITDPTKSAGCHAFLNSGWAL
ncbi:hypothetical protein V6N11_059265 [Hibiscus sabdariffa]|uniref:Uncharacterized protein n=1 Tax=Hibiscus sabdariffa TaxID=183260 RepID=A0ABR2U6Z3_9ROSI